MIASLDDYYSHITASGMSRRRLGAEIAYAIFRANRPIG